MILLDTIDLADRAGGEVRTAASWALYPDPVTDTIHVRVEGAPFGPLQLQVIDAVGRVALVQRLPSSAGAEVDIPGLASGSCTVLLATPGLRLMKGVEVVR